MPFPPMPPPPSEPVKPHVLVGILTDRKGAYIKSGAPVIFYNESTDGARRVLVRTGGEILSNLANLSDWSYGDKIRVQCIDNKGNGEVWYAEPSSGTGITLVTQTVRAIEPVCGKRADRFMCRSVVKV